MDFFRKALWFGTIKEALNCFSFIWFCYRINSSCFQFILLPLDSSNGIQFANFNSIEIENWWWIFKFVHTMCLKSIQPIHNGHSVNSNREKFRFGSLRCTRVGIKRIQYGTSFDFFIISNNNNICIDSLTFRLDKKKTQLNWNFSVKICLVWNVHWN